MTAQPDSHHRKYIVYLNDWFKHQGPNGVHICMSFEVLGPNLLNLIRQSKHQGLEIDRVKKMTKQILMGLEYMHDKCGIIHTDLKPENVLVGVTVSDGFAEEIENFQVKQKELVHQSKPLTKIKKKRILYRERVKAKKQEEKKMEDTDLSMETRKTADS